MEVTLISTYSSFQGWLAEKCTEIPATILKTNILSLVLPLYGDNLRCHGRPYDLCSFWNIVQMKWQILKFINHFPFVIWYSFQTTILNAAI